MGIPQIPILLKSPPSMAVLKGLSRENYNCSTFIFRTMLWNPGGFLGLDCCASSQSN